MRIKEMFSSYNTNDGFIDLLDKHRALDHAIRDDKGKVFLSDWYCYHPYIDRYTNDIEITKQQKQDYVFYSDDKELAEMITKMHKRFDNKEYNINEVLPGDGSTPFIAAFCVWLLKNDIKEVYYVPPMYYTFYYFLEIFKIRAKPVSAKQIYENNVTLNLPDKKSYLILCDPVWYVGQSVKSEYIKQIARWQEKTGSYIFVDGSFQYSQWSDNRYEHTSIFDKEKTFRLICATKFLALHGYRFSYLLLPSRFYEEFLYLYANNIGSTNAYNPIFAKKAISIMLEKDYNKDLTFFIEKIYKSLVSKKTIYTELEPNSGYFIFAKIIKEIDGYHSMSQEYFEQKNYPNYIRINLLGGKNIEPIMQ
jgi:aspartate/methionine/tyrosine aminotransferase